MRSAEAVPHFIVVRSLFAAMALLVLLCPVDVVADPATVTLDRSIEAASEYNRELIQARARIEEVQRGDRIIIRSRYLPHLSVTTTYDVEPSATTLSGETEDEFGGRLEYAQRLFEFGPNATQEIGLRADLRQALFAYQDKLHEVHARVWQLFHLIVLQDEQIQLRRESRENFMSTLERQQARFDKRLASEEDKLNAELNVLNEDLAINRLVRQQFNNKMELLRLIGRPIGAEVELEGETVPFPVDQDEAVAMALRRDVGLALREEQLSEQQRLVTEVNWEYSPDLSVSAGFEDGRTDATINVDRRAGTWGLDVESGYDLKQEHDPGPEAEDPQWSAQVEARMPIFEGGSRIGQKRRERAKLERLMEEIRDLRAGVDLRVRQAFQSMLEAEEQQRIQEKRVFIARRPLEINQYLKDKGRADEAKLEQVRDQFFKEQDNLFDNQANYINRQTELRRLMGFVE